LPLRPRATRVPFAAATLATALVAASPCEAHGIFDLVLTGGPLLGVEPISGTALGGVSVSGGLGGGDSLTALVFRFELLGALGGFEGVAFGGAVMFRWDLGARSRRIGLAAGIAGGVPLAGLRAELIVPLSEHIALTATVSPGVRVAGEGAWFAVPVFVGLDFGNF
jgi:hypothetical protein